KLFLAAAGAKQDGQKSGFILFAFLSVGPGSLLPIKLPTLRLPWRATM
ncbi:MAG: hypothetical protein ACI9G6_001927, partial [Limisphaerales bacterium]